jgi:hypothetical protein
MSAITFTCDCPYILYQCSQSQMLGLDIWHDISNCSGNGTVMFVAACWDWFTRRIARWNQNDNHFKNILLYTCIKLFDVCTKEKRSTFFLYILKLNTVYIFSNIFICLCLYFPKMFTILHTIIKIYYFSS